MSEELNKLNTAPAKKGGISVDFADSPELFAMIDQYRRNLGWTWKRLMLVGVANSIAKQGDNPDLVVAIADYLENRR